jgi:hypothetical protein
VLKFAFHLLEDVLGAPQQQLAILRQSDHVLKEVGSVIGPDTGVIDLVDDGSDGAAVTAVGQGLLQHRQAPLVFPGDREHGGIDKTDIPLAPFAGTIVDNLVEPVPVELDIDIKNVHETSSDRKP